jgi:hypothetical protein
MTFAALQERLLEIVRERIRNGALSERQLAKLSGISQPHMHNILKGKRVLQTRLGDEILRQLRMNTADLTTSASTGEECYRPVPLLAGTLGTEMRYFQPERTAGSAYLPASIVKAAHRPLAARLGEDPEITSQFQPGNLILIDQSPESRSQLLTDAAYIAVTAHGPRIRFVREGHSRLYLLPSLTRNRPSRWEVALYPKLTAVRGRVIWLSREVAI